MIDPLIWYIHGANSTPTSFNYIINELPRHEKVCFSYGHVEPVETIVEEIALRAAAARIASGGRPINVVGHSLGGVIAVAVAQKTDLGGRIATISSPFGGSKVAGLMRWITPCRLFDDIYPASPIMQAIQRGGVVPQTMSIVSTSGGTHLMPEENDGVVTIASQTALTWPTYLKVPVNHFESLLSDDVLDLINGHMFQD